MTDYQEGLLILAVILLPMSGSLRVSNACYGQGPCSRHDLACGVTSRLAIVSASHGFKRKHSLCPGRDINPCNFNDKLCCSEDKVFDCTFPFKDVYLRTLYEKCSGKNNCSYYTDRVQKECSTTTKTLSSFSSIRFSCIEDTDITRFWNKSTSSGRSVYAVFDPESFHAVSNPLRQYSCRVEPGKKHHVAVNVSLNALDVRFDNVNPGHCSSLLIRHASRPSINISCGAYGKRTFLSQVSHIQTVPTPVDLLLSLSEDNMPGYLWIQIESDTSDLVLTCGALEKGWLKVHRTTEEENVFSSTAGTSSAVGAVVGGLILLAAVAAIFVVVIRWKRSVKVTKYLQTIPLQSSCSKETVERRFRGQTGSSDVVDRTVTLQVRPPTSAQPEESIYEHILFNDDVAGVSAGRMYHHVRHVTEGQDASTASGTDDGYDKGMVGISRLPKSDSAYDTTESASRDTNDVRRNIQYDHLERNRSITAHCEDIYENATDLIADHGVLTGLKD